MLYLVFSTVLHVSSYEFLFLSGFFDNFAKTCLQFCSSLFDCYANFSKLPSSFFLLYLFIDFCFCSMGKFVLIGNSNWKHCWNCLVKFMVA
uniref:DNA-directed RNA polymerases I II and III 17.1 kDa polypeptide n=1 Tax=Rhizophora mucronata TaxID=61149 RepID=A0A2P2K6S4_RHIMU